MSSIKPHNIFTGAVQKKGTKKALAVMRNTVTSQTYLMDERDLFKQVRALHDNLNTPIPDSFSAPEEEWSFIFALAAVQGKEQAYGTELDYPKINKTLTEGYEEEYTPRPA